MGVKTMNTMKTPKSVDLSLTSNCNLRCRYCSHFTGPGAVDIDLPKAEWLKFFGELKRCAVLNVTISGGEPFYRQDLKELIEGIVQNRMRFSVLSNGTLITEEMADFLAASKRCETVQVSIDGSIPTTHDACRGEGNFLKAVRGIKFLQKYRVPVSVRVTIHRHNVGELDEIARFLLEDMGLPGFSTNSAAYMGLCRKNAGQIQLTPQERTLAIATLLRLEAKYNGRISASAGPLAEGKAWITMEHACREGKERIAGRGYLTGCGGFFSKLAVRSDGAMVPCAQMSHIELGRINRDNLKEVWESHPELKRLRERRNIPLSEFAFCRGCGYLNYCTGSCPALAYTILNNDNHPSPDACFRRFLEEGGRLPEEMLLTASHGKCQE